MRRRSLALRSLELKESERIYAIGGTGLGEVTKHHRVDLYARLMLRYRLS